MITRHLNKIMNAARRRYAQACARDDAARRQFRIPSGVWACGRCRYASFDARSLIRHEACVHAV